MKPSSLLPPYSVFGSTATLVALVLAGATTVPAEGQTPTDLSQVRGFNYTAAYVEPNPRHHIDHWTNYYPEVTDFDLDLARRLDLNQVRIVVSPEVFEADPELMRRNLLHFVRAAHERGIGMMPVVGYIQDWIDDPSLRPRAREWAEFLVATLGDEPGLAFWDVMNEPDWPTDPERVATEFEYAKFMADLFHELDPDTPVTIGMAFVSGMEQLADYVDVLSFHDYSGTRAEIRANIERAEAFAEGVGKPVFNTEIGCVARANPYDVTLEEHMDAGVGWYIWELMIVRRGWGTIHGVFYEDGTVRDPSIAAAILGFFRKRTEDVLPAVADREGRVTRVVADGREWLAEDDASWADGLDLAEAAAYLLEAGELVPMHDLPTRRVYLMRAGEPDMDGLRALLTELIGQLEPHRLEPGG